MELDENFSRELRERDEYSIPLSNSGDPCNFAQNIYEGFAFSLTWNKLTLRLYISLLRHLY